MRVWLLAALAALCGAAGGRQDAAVVHLFNGKDLSPFYTWLVNDHYADPDHVYSVVDAIDGAPAIRISGQKFGGLVTKQEYENYRLTVEYRWGLLTWGARKAASKDSGVLVHAQGTDGSYAKDFNGAWMRCVECQVIQGGTGDIILVPGYDASGKGWAPSLTCTARHEGSQIVYDPSAPAEEFKNGRINWWGRDPAWTDTLGFRGKSDVESPGGEWTRVEVVCDRDRITNIVNGQVVNAGVKCSQTRGKVILQSEGAEVYYRKVDLQPLPR